MFRSLNAIVCAISLLVALGGCAELGGDLVFASYCYDVNIHDYVCCDKYTPREHPACNDAGADAEADATDDAETDAGADDGGPTADASSLVCPGQCVPQGGGGFSEMPLFVWMGETWETPPKALAANPVWNGWVDVKVADAICPVCACAPPANGCTLSVPWTARSSACQDASASTLTAFDPPMSWDGSCSSVNGLDANLTCDGEPCAQSLLIEPPIVDSSCAALPKMDPDGEPLSVPEMIRAIVYSADDIGNCEGGIDRCIMETPPGYRLCVGRYDDDGYSCPPDWPERHDGWQKLKDDRFCTACTCGDVEGATCIVRATAYSDQACSQVATTIFSVSNEATKCADLMNGTALGSKTAEVLSHEPGMCVPSTSEIVGAVEMKEPVALCCLPITQ